MVKDGSGGEGERGTRGRLGRVKKGRGSAESMLMTFPALICPFAFYLASLRFLQKQMNKFIQQFYRSFKADVIQNPKPNVQKVPKKAAIPEYSKATTCQSSGQFQSVSLIGHSPPLPLNPSLIPP
jgi:hypothetical protein